MLIFFSSPHKMFYKSSDFHPCIKHIYFNFEKFLPQDATNFTFLIKTPPNWKNLLLQPLQ